MFKYEEYGSINLGLRPEERITGMQTLNGKLYAFTDRRVFIIKRKTWWQRVRERLAMISRLLLLVVMLSAAALGQDIFTVQPVDPSAPKNVHEYALQVIKETYEYRMKPRKMGEFTTIPDTTFTFTNATFSFASGGKQSFFIDKDGKITLENITMEDALLVMAAMQAEDTLRRQREWDREEAKREEEAERNPPSTLKVGKDYYKVVQRSDLSRINPTKGVLAVTQCSQKRIDYLVDQGAKRNSVLHEMMHVATACDDSQSLHDSIYQMSSPLLKMMQDNPKMMDYLLKREEKHGEATH